MTETLKLPVLPLTDSVLLPGMVVPVRLDEPEIQAAVDAASSVDRKILVVPRLDGRYAAVGTVAVLEQVGRLPSGEKAAVVRGEVRARIGSGVTGPGAALWVEAEKVTDPAPTGRVLELAKEYKALVVSILQQRDAWQVIDSVEQMTDPGALADLAGWASYFDDAQKAQLLAETDVQRRLEQLLEWTKEHLAEQEVSEKIGKDVREGMEKQQREFLLRQQLAAIRKELGEGEPEGTDDYRARVEAADLPEHVLKAALKEVDKLERSSDQSPEAGWIRTWLDTVLDIPWNDRTEDNDDLVAARAVLDADHAGLDDVKERLIEFLAVRARRNRRGLATVGGRGSGAVLALVGPPGVGKTSLGESVARALGRKFVRVALGGVRDEAEIRGHRRTYVGALPGRIVRAIREAGSMNPVVLLDEIDKVGSRLPRRPDRGAARGARPGAEPHVPRPLPGGRPRPVRRAVPRDGQRRRGHPRPAGRPHGEGDARRLHRGGEGRHRARPPAAAADREGRPGDLGRRVLRGGPGHDRRRVHPRGGRAAAGAGPGEGPAQGRPWPSTRVPRRRCTSTPTRWSSSWAGRGSPRSRRSARRCRAWRRDWP